MGERWKAVVGFEGFYEVSDHGRVRALGRVIKTSRGSRDQKGGTLAPFIDHLGYVFYGLSRGNKRIRRGAHSLVAAAFIGPRPERHDVRHLDGDPGNNTPKNLLYGTRLENEQDKRRHGRITRGEKHGMAILSEAQVMEIWSLKGTITHQKIADRFGVARETVGLILRGKNWSWLTLGTA